MNELQQLMDAIKGFTEIDDELLTDDTMKSILDGINEQFSPAVLTQSINQMIQNLENQGLNKVEAADAVRALSETINDIVYGDNKFEGNKKILVDTVTSKVMGIFTEALDRYHNYSIVLPMALDAGAQIPTYAHETDAAADLYALETTVLEGNTLGNKIKTGVKIQLPEGWLAMILPRSSMGAKTPLRLSNSVGLIDSGYRGELGVLYDNISDSPYTINKGDRIAQLLVMPSYRFQPKLVDVLVDSDRGETGFGDSGK